MSGWRARSHDGSPLTQQVLDRTLRRLATSAGIAPPEGAMAHALRHTYGMDLAMRGVPLSVIQQLMGHDDPARHRSTPSPTPRTSPPPSPTPALSEAASRRTTWESIDHPGQWCDPIEGARAA